MRRVVFAFTVVMLVLGLTSLANGVQAAPKSKSSTPPARSLEERVARMERLLDSQGLVEMVVKLDNLQAELQRLRGEIEVQTHTLEELKARQRELYLDIDRRLVQVERNGVGAGGAGTGAAAAAGATTAGAAAAARPSVKSGEPEAYQKAFDLLRELRYADAVNAFTTFLADYPDGRYAHIAQYWLAEANYARREFKAAIDDYRTLIKRYPNSPKLAEAMLKVGYSYYELNEFQQSSDTLQQLIARFPGTTEAQQAQNLLRQVKLKQRG